MKLVPQMMKMMMMKMMILLIFCQIGIFVSQCHYIFWSLAVQIVDVCCVIR